MNEKTKTTKAKKDEGLLAPINDVANLPKRVRKLEKKVERLEAILEASGHGKGPEDEGDD